MPIGAKVVEDSITYSGIRLTTLQLVFPRFILPEFNTHRVFSRNASSSRAIPVAKMIEQVRTNPAMPVHWGANKPGMQAGEEIQPEANRVYARALWVSAANNAADTAETMMKMGLHKQVVNRLLEPFQFIHVVVTSTEWENFFALRDHPAADPNIQALAKAMKIAMDESTPIERNQGEWHLPYVLPSEREQEHLIPFLQKISAARCARVSYVKHDGMPSNLSDDLALYEQLVGSMPIHASPVEHIATPFNNPNERSGNFIGWLQYRKQIEAEFK